MTIQELLRAMRARWLIIVATAAVAVAATVFYNILTTPLYESSTRLFVSTSAAPGDASQIYSGTLSSQQRVVSYTKLLTGETLAQRVVDKLHLDMTAEALRKEVKATAPPDTVLIDVSVLDASPVRARDIADALSDEFVVMVRELETPPDGEAPVARVVVEQHASVAAKPVIPETTRNIAIGLALGVLLGIALAILRDRLDNTVKSRQVFEEIAGAGLIANIPFDKDRRKDPGISFANDVSPIAEAFRELRTNLQFLEVDDPPRVLVVTSSLPDEGKSTIAINIALALAEADYNVVVIDGDMRRPKLAEYLDVIGSVGLSTVLAGRASLPEVLQKTRFPGLTALTSGAVPPNPSELLGSEAAKKVLRELRGGFDYVIVDSSPLLAVTDSAILAAESDGVLVIAKFATTKREQLAQAIENLTKVGARILGGIFAMSPTGKTGNYHYPYYGKEQKPAAGAHPAFRHGADDRLRHRRKQ
ncbi:protein tyrosine kinase [Mycobacterium sp. ACS1612]|uniref:polysaccharide biosynthesis tyrosine autokinase n=1 Tax=Mycobacterium sp. ACS1612 TaxID=1834117 RepID=UPI0007FD64EC|nr:polysaccharide biosynthesis tyrosine autokinase [Mycobacterium sp. ACS1612]OBF32945.1 protein tyrosine kinase [Mycobacterium sp. ACS1612]